MLSDVSRWLEAALQPAGALEAAVRPNDAFRAAVRPNEAFCAALRPLEALERELKFVVPAGRAPLVLRWLRARCRADATFPAAFVWTVYYDTTGLRSLEEKINSDYMKTKVRLRWYSERGEGCEPGPSFIEAKYRIGNRREKVRAPTPYSAESLRRARLGSAELARLPELLRPHGVILDEPWHPVLLLRYRRYRFLEPTSGARVSLDDEIRAVAANPRFVPAGWAGRLPAAVVEVKGPADAMPPALRSLLHLGCRATSFSKYCAVYRRVTRAVL